MAQKYDIWDVVPGRIVSLSIDSVIDDWEGFRVLMRDHDTGGILRIAFDYHVGYQYRDESNLAGEAALFGFEGLGRGYFYRVRDSAYLERFKANALRVYDNLEHFAIVTDTYCIDILAEEKPRIEQL